MIDLDRLIRDADPVRKAVIPTADKADARRVAAAARASRRRLEALWLGAGVAVALGVAAITLISVAHHRDRVTGAPLSSAQAAAAPLVRILGVLRRPQTASDKAVELKVLRGAPDLPLVRLAGVTPWGEQVILVPQKARPHDTLNLVARSARGGSGAGGITANVIESSGLDLLEGPGTLSRWRGVRLIMVVPDGVAKVAFVSPTPIRGSNLGELNRTSSAVTVPVHNNVAFAQLAHYCCGATPVMRWYAADGRLIKITGNAAVPRQITSRIGARPGGGVPTAPVPISTGSPPAQQLGLLGVLRRPPTGQDRSQQVARALTQLFGGLNGLEINYVRVLWDTPRDGLVLLIPAKSWSAPPLPSGQAPQVIRNPLCLVTIPPSSRGSSGSCEPTEVLTSGHLNGSSGSFEYAVVPDSVAKVVVHFPGGSSQTLDVRDNFVAIQPERSDRPGAPVKLPSSVQWLDTAGRLVPQHP